MVEAHNVMRLYEFVLCFFAGYSECADAGFRRLSRMREQKFCMVSDRREFESSSRTISSRGLSAEPARTVVYVREEFRYMRCIRT